MDACDDMSAISRSTCEDPDSRRISSSAAFPFSAFRQTMTARAHLGQAERRLFPNPTVRARYDAYFPAHIRRWHLSNVWVDYTTNLSRRGC
jgi:hypothetical protein